MEERLSEYSRQMRERKSKQRKSPFFCGPVPLAWLVKACGLPGKSLQVAVAVWHRLKVSKHTVASVTPKLLASFQVGRKAGYLGLKHLESAGLVKVNRRRGRSPRATILELNQKQEADE